MKNIKKITALCTLLVLCFSLSGCAFSTFDLSTPLAKQRQEHGFWGEKNAAGEYDSIVYNDQKYLRLRSNTELYFQMTHRVIITQPDVPLLLREPEGNWMERSEDSKFIFGYGEENTYFCREDCFEQMKERLTKPFQPEIYAYEYTDANWEWAFAEVSQKDMDTLFSLRENGKLHSLALDEIELEDVSLYSGALKYYEGHGYGLVATIEGCSKDLLQRRGAVTVLLKGKTFYLCFEDDLLYSVPKKYNKLIRTIFAKLADSPAFDKEVIY